MTFVINDAMRARIRATLPDLKSAGADALVPIKEMSPHFMSLRGDHPENGLMKLSPVEVDGVSYFVYLQQR